MPILILAVPGVLLSTALTAALLYFGMDHPQGFPWPAALLAGTILAATHPIMAVAFAVVIFS